MAQTWNITGTGNDTNIAVGSTSTTFTATGVATSVLTDIQKTFNNCVTGGLGQMYADVNIDMGFLLFDNNSKLIRVSKKTSQSIADADRYWWTSLDNVTPDAMLDLTVDTSFLASYPGRSVNMKSRIVDMPDNATLDKYGLLNSYIDNSKNFIVNTNNMYLMMAGTNKWVETSTAPTYLGGGNDGVHKEIKWPSVEKTTTSVRNKVVSAINAQNNMYVYGSAYFGLSWCFVMINDKTVVRLRSSSANINMTRAEWRDNIVTDASAAANDVSYNRNGGKEVTVGFEYRYFNRTVSGDVIKLYGGWNGIPEYVTSGEYDGMQGVLYPSVEIKTINGVEILMMTGDHMIFDYGTGPIIAGLGGGGGQYVTMASPANDMSFAKLTT